MNKPPVLYKYEAFSTQSLANLKRHIMYFGSPLNFNDPYDCAITPNIKIPCDDELALLRKGLLHKNRGSEKFCAAVRGCDNEKLRTTLVDAAHAGVDDAIKKFGKNNGITCFSEKNDDLLMWSHYGGRYKGFCLEFETSGQPFQKVRKVQYVKTLPELRVSDVLLDNNFEEVFKLFCTKSDAWAYESEWRAVHHVAGTAFGYSPEVLKGVYFGPDIDRHFIEIVCLVLAGQNEHVKFWRGRRSTTEFRVLFEPFTYISFLEGKRKGLI